MRGYLFEISQSPNHIGDLTADMFSETKDGSCYADAYQDAKPSTVLKKYLTIAQKHNITYGFNRDVPYVILDPVSKKSLFLEKFQMFRKIAKTLTLDVFASDEMSSLQNLIENTYGDAVYLVDDGYAVSADEFIRRAVPGIPYFIGNVLMME